MFKSHQSWLISARVIGLIAIVLVLVLSCSGPNEPEPAGPAAIVSISADSSLPGEVTRLSVWLDYTDGGRHRLDSLSGFMLRIEYDSRVLSFLGGIDAGPAISNWEYFTYRYQGGKEHEWGYTPGYIYVLSAREFDNGVPVDPPQSLPEGLLLTLDFHVTSEWEWIDSTTTLVFRTLECGDNSFQPDHQRQHYYIAMDSFDGDSTALTDTLDCPRRISVEPMLGFRGGSVTIVEPEFGPGDTLNLYGP